ncbi:MAG: 50S ribosomal protein L27 [bacterium]|nr:50S ribosomal protein L27 [bacterium]
MSKTKAGGSTKLGRDSQSKRLGVKLFGGQIVQPGNIIVRQRGTKYINGENTILSRDHTIVAKTNGKVKFSKLKKLNFCGNHIKKTVVAVTLD